MTKFELIEAVAQRAPALPKRDIALVVETVFESMSHALAAKDRIEIRGFGSFAAKKRGSRLGRNPRTGEQVDVAEKWVPSFTAGKALRERLNEVASTQNEAPSV